MTSPATRVLLALDTSSPRAQVALATEDGRVLAAAEADTARHAPGLLALCDRVLTTANFPLAQLFGVACGAGPGNFTGLRVGLAAGKGLAFAMGLRFYLVSSLYALAIDLMRGSHRTRTSTGGLSPGSNVSLWPCIDAGKGEVHLQGFTTAPNTPPDCSSTLVPLAPAVRCAATEVAREIARTLHPLHMMPTAAALKASAQIIGGSGLDRHREKLAPLPAGFLTLEPHVGPTAEAIAQLAFERVRSGTPDDLDTAAPNYGRPPDISQPRPRDLLASGPAVLASRRSAK